MRVRKLVSLTPAAHVVLDACRRAGGRPLVVGGSVRDAFLHLPSKDLDIEVHGVELALLQRELERVGTVDAVGRAFGVLKVRRHHEDFDVSLPRVDSKVGDGHRGFEVRVDHNLTELEAFGRRDFTINAMGWDPHTEELIDPFDGVGDLRRWTLRHTTDAFADDPLRVLRAVQFAGRFGFKLAPETIALCRELAPSFHELPKERVWEEFHKIATKANHPSLSLQALHDVGWEQFFPELVAVRDVPQDPHWHPEGPVHVHLGLAADMAVTFAIADGLSEQDRMVVVFAAMLHDLGKATHTALPDPSLAATGPARITSHGHAEAGVEPARAFLRRIGAPHWLEVKVLPIIREHMVVASMESPSPAAVRRLMRRLDHPGGRGPGMKLWATVVAADHAARGPASGPSPADEWMEVARRVGTPQVRAQAGILTGKHLIAAGLKPGPLFSEILAAGLEAQDAGNFSTEEGAIWWLRHMQGRMARWH